MDPDQEIRIQRMVAVNEQLISGLNSLLDEGTSWDTEQGIKFLENPDGVLFLAFSGTKVIGFLTAYLLQRLDKRRAEVLLYEIAVSEQFQKKGVGKKLVEAVKKWAKGRDADEVWVLTYNSNQAAMSLYKSAGGEEDMPGTRMFSFKI